MEPSDLADTLTDAIEQVIDTDAFNAEIEAEESDSQQIVAVKRQAEEFFKSLRLEAEDI
jgi:hypothetical protein